MSTAPAPLGHPARSDRRVALLVIGALALIAATAATTYALVHDSSSSSTDQGSGVPASESRTVASFDSVELSGSNNVTITVGETQSVRVFGDDNLINRVTTNVRSDALVIGNRAGSLAAQTPMRVEIGVPSLSALTLSGSGNISVAGIDQPRMRVTISGSGVVRASGTTDELDVTISGSGDAQLDPLVASAARAVVSGSGLIAVTATESLDASVPGTGAIVYGGNPSKVTKTVTGDGAITSR
jgi:hypothetical protein